MHPLLKCETLWNGLKKWSFLKYFAGYVQLFVCVCGCPANVLLLLPAWKNPQPFSGVKPLFLSLLCTNVCL